TILPPPAPPSLSPTPFPAHTAHHENQISVSPPNPRDPAVAPPASSSAHRLRNYLRPAGSFPNLPNPDSRSSAQSALRLFFRVVLPQKCPRDPSQSSAVPRARIPTAAGAARG